MLLTETGSNIAGPSGRVRLQSTAPLADSYKEFAYGLYSKVTSPLYRVIGQEPDVRDNGAHINVNESIDKSVFDRWRMDPSYRPRNLVEWADRKHVDPA